MLSWGVWTWIAACHGPASEPSATAVLGPSGGEIALAVSGANGEPDATLTLSFPEGALAEEVTVEIAAQASVGDGLASFRLSPAGLRLGAPVVVAYASEGELPSDARFSWALPDTTVWVPGRVDGGTLTSTVWYLGDAGGDATSARLAPGATASGGGTAASLGVAQITCDQAVTDAIFAVQTDPVRLKDVAALSRAATAIAAVQETCTRIEVERVAAEACARYDAVATAVDAVVVDSLDAFYQAILRLTTAIADVQLTGGSCDTQGYDALAGRKFEQLVTLLGADMLRLSDDMDDAFDAIADFVQLDAVCRLAAIDAATCELGTQALLPAFLSDVHQLAWTECQSRRRGYALTSLLTEAKGSPGLLERYASFSEDDLMREAGRCAMDLTVAAFEDPHGVPAQVDEQRLVAGATVDAGPFEVTLRAPPTGSFHVSGALPTAPCPDGATSGERLAFRVGATEIGGVSAAGDGFAISPVTLEWIVPDLLDTLGLAPSTPSFDVQIVRDGAACGDIVLPQPVATVHVVIREPSPCAILDPSLFSFDDAPRTEAHGALAVQFADAVDPHDQVGTSSASISGSGVYDGGLAYAFDAAATATGSTLHVDAHASGGSAQPPFVYATASASSEMKMFLGGVRGVGTGRIHATVVITGEGTDVANLDEGDLRYRSSLRSADPQGLAALTLSGLAYTRSAGNDGPGAFSATVELDEPFSFQAPNGAGVWLDAIFTAISNARGDAILTQGEIVVETCTP